MAPLGIFTEISAIVMKFLALAPHVTGVKGHDIDKGYVIPIGFSPTPTLYDRSHAELEMHLVAGTCKD